MNKIKKLIVTALIACVACFVGVFALAACEEPAKKPTEPALKSIAVTKQPDKVVYVSGSEFDPTGMEVTAYYDNNKSKVLVSTDYTVSAPTLTVAAGQETTKEVSVSYTEKSVEKTTAFDVTVTNKATGIAIKNNPTNIVYEVGDTFDPSGMKVTVTYEDNSQAEVTVTKSNAQFSPSEIAADTEKVTVTYGGFTVAVDVIVEVEDETKSVTVDSADITTPVVTLENVDGVPHIVIGGGAYTTTVEGYDLANAADKAIVDKKISTAIKALYHFAALNNPISSIEGYDTLIENGSHTVKLLEGNKFEVRCDLSDLTAGGIYGVRFVKLGSLSDTPHDSDYNFNSTNFPSFTKLELTTLVVGTVKYDAFYNDDESGIDFDWDCLAIAVTEMIPSYTDKSVALEQDENGKVYLVVSGEYKYYSEEALETELAKVKGDYRYDQQLGNAENKDIAFAQENITYTVTAGEYDGTYEVKIELTDYTPGIAFFHYDYEDGDTNLKLPLEDGKVEIVSKNDNRKFELFITKNTGTEGGWADGLVAIEITDTAFMFESAEIADPEVTLKEIDGKPYLVIGGGEYVASYDEADVATEEGKAVIEGKIVSAIKDMYYLAALNNPIGGISGYETLIENGSYEVVLSDGDKFEIRCDLSALVAGGIYGVRFVNTTTLGEETTESDYDFNSAHFPAFTKLELTTLLMDSVKYDAFYNDDESGIDFDWDCLAIAVTEMIPSYTDKSVTLEQDENGKVYLVVSGEYKYYSEEALETELAKVKGDYRYDQQLGNAENKDVAFDSDAITYNVTVGEYGGTYEVKIELTDFTPGTAFFHYDYEDVEEKTNLKLPLKNGEVIFENETANRRFTLFITANTGTSGGWADGLVAIKIVDTSIKSRGDVEPVNIQQDVDKVYLVITGECSGYTAQEIKGMINVLNFEPSHGDKTIIVADSEDIIVTVSNGRYVIKYDLTTLNVVYDDNGNFGGYWMHFKWNEQEGNGDIGNSNGTTPVKVNGTTYAVEDYHFGWGNGNILTIKKIKVFAPEKAEFITDDESIYYAVTFATENYTQGEIESKLSKIDLESTAGGRTVYEGDDLIFGELGEDGKVIVKIDITSLGAGVYVPHYFVDGKVDNGDGKNICDNAAVEAVTVGNKTYEVKETTVSAWNWTAHLINVTEA